MKTLEAATLSKPTASALVVACMSFTVMGADSVEVADFLFTPSLAAVTSNCVSTLSRRTMSRAAARATWRECVAKGYAKAA